MNLSLLHITNEKPWGWVHQKWKIHSLTSHPNVDGKITTNQQPHQKKKTLEAPRSQNWFAEILFTALEPRSSMWTHIRYWDLGLKKKKGENKSTWDLGPFWDLDYTIQGEWNHLVFSLICFFKFLKQVPISFSNPDAPEMFGGLSIFTKLSFSMRVWWVMS